MPDRQSTQDSVILNTVTSRIIESIHHAKRMRGKRKETRHCAILDSVIDQDIAQLDVTPTTPPFPHPKPAIPILSASYHGALPHADCHRTKDDDKEYRDVEEDSLRPDSAATIIQRSWKRYRVKRSVCMLHLEPPSMALGGHVAVANGTDMRLSRDDDSLEAIEESEPRDHDHWISKSSDGLACTWLDDELSFLEEGRRVIQPEQSLQAGIESGEHCHSWRNEFSKCVEKLDPVFEINEGMSQVPIVAVGSEVNASSVPILCIVSESSNDARRREDHEARPCSTVKSQSHVLIHFSRRRRARRRVKSLRLYSKRLHVQPTHSENRADSDARSALNTTSTQLAPPFIEFRGGGIHAQPTLDGRSDLISIKDTISTAPLGILDSCIGEFDELHDYSRIMNGFIRLEDALRERQFDTSGHAGITTDLETSNNQDAEILSPPRSRVSLRNEFQNVLKEFRQSLYGGSEACNEQDHQLLPAPNTAIVCEPDELKDGSNGGLIVFDRTEESSSSRCLSIADDPVDKQLEAMIREIQECKSQIARARWTNQALRSLAEPSTD